MEDIEIIDLYNSRNESAIKETQDKYGRMLHSISYNILSNNSDSEEIVNDTYNKAWNAIPPEKPTYLGAYLGRITRNLSINLWKSKRALKRYDGVDILLSELEECIPSNESLEDSLETKEITKSIDKWLDSLEKDDRVLFLKRYWYGESLNSLAKEVGTSANKLAGRMYRLRESLRKALEGEGIFI